MNKADKAWARAKIFEIIDTPTAQLLGEDPRDKCVSMNVHKSPPYKNRTNMKREKFSHEEQQMQLFAKYVANELKKRGFDHK